MPRVSVIMNCLNGEKYLKEAIDSVFAQTCEDWEIVFWDNASTDSSPEIARSYGEKVRYFRSPETHPLGKARSLATEKAQGEYIALLDCDDVWAPEKLERQLGLFERDPNLALVFSDCYYTSEEGKITGRNFEKYRFKNFCACNGSVFIQLLQRYFTMCPTLIFKKDVFHKVGGFNPRAAYSADRDLVLRIARQYPISFVSTPLAYYRVHSTSESAKKPPTAKRREEIELLKSMLNTLPDLNGAEIRAIRWRIFKVYVALLLGV